MLQTVAFCCVGGETTLFSVPKGDNWCHSSGCPNIRGMSPNLTIRCCGEGRNARGAFDFWTTAGLSDYSTVRFHDQSAMERIRPILRITAFRFIPFVSMTNPAMNELPNPADNRISDTSIRRQASQNLAAAGIAACERVAGTRHLVGTKAGHLIVGERGHDVVNFTSLAPGRQ